MGLYDRDYMREPRPRAAASRVFETGSSMMRSSGSETSGKTLANFMVAVLGLVALGWIGFQTYSGILPATFSSLVRPSAVGTWQLDKASSVAARRVFLEQMIMNSKGSNRRVDLGDWFLAQMIGELNQAALELQAAEWEMEVVFQSNQTFAIKELTWFYGFESGGTWQYSEPDNSAIQLTIPDLGVIDGRWEDGQLILIAIEPKSQVEFPLAVLSKRWW
jgi:hypothetical protein